MRPHELIPNLIVRRGAPVKRLLIRVILATAFIGTGWSLGKAQTRVADFEIAIESPRGDLKVTCSRGCDWTRADGEAIATISFQCKAERCLGQLNGHGKVIHDTPR